jgi:hypothetical protein
MRPLNTTTLKVEGFIETGTGARKYAILSYTWGEEEVTLQDMQGELPIHRKGFSKLQGSCSQARKDGYDHI